MNVLREKESRRRMVSETGLDLLRYPTADFEVSTDSLTPRNK